MRFVTSILRTRVLVAELTIVSDVLCWDADAVFLHLGARVSRKSGYRDTENGCEVQIPAAALARLNTLLAALDAAGDIV